MEKQQDTIFAEATAGGRGAISIFRISGPRARAAIELMSGKEVPDARRASVRRLMHPETDDLLDEAVVLWLPGPTSFTGEDMVELHCHGGGAVRSAVIGGLGAISAFRPAEPGDFSKRAFFAGRLDLTRAEGIDDLVSADTAQQRRQALRQMGGALSTLCDDWRSRLIAALAHVEAEIDFVDEPLPAGLIAHVRSDVAEIVRAIEVHLADKQRGERLRDGLSVVIVGSPNAGKSSIINRLSMKEAAIVSNIAGTTRDVVEVHMDLDGLLVSVSDTAGIREAAGEIEREGVRRSLQAAEAADIRLVVLDGRTWPTIDADVEALVDDASVVVVNKMDVVEGPKSGEIGGRAVRFMSCLSGEGVDDLMSELTSLLNERYGVRDSVAFTRERHRAALVECCGAMTRFLDGGSVELAAEDLRLAARALGRINGRVDVEELLDVIFRDFCIGK